MAQLISFLSSFMISLILLTPSIKIFASPISNATITDKLIDEICQGTRNSPLCLKNLKFLKGKSLAPNFVASLGMNTMNMALNRANRTWINTRGLSYGVSLPGTQRIKYYMCFMRYTDVMKQLKDAKNSMIHGEARSVKTYTENAVNAVNSCDKELMKPPRATLFILENNGTLKDLCSIILAICSKSVTSPK